MANVPFFLSSALRSQPGVMARQTVRLFLASGGRIAIQILLIPVLARIIAPEAFGLVAMAMPVIIFVSILAEAGLVTGLVRTEVEQGAESSAFWFSAGVGAAMDPRRFLKAGDVVRCDIEGLGSIENTMAAEA